MTDAYDTDDEETSWDDVPPMLREYIVSALKKERAAVAHAKIEGQVMAAVLTGTLTSSIGEMITKVDGVPAPGTERAAAALGEMMGSMTSATSQAEDARVAAFDAAIRRLEEPRRS